MPLLAMVAIVAGAVVPAEAAPAMPQSPRPYFAPGESFGEVRYVLRFGQPDKGTESLAGSGMQAHDAYGSGKSRRQFSTSSRGQYNIAYKTTCCGERVDKHVRNGIPTPGANLGDLSWHDGTSLWLSHSRFKAGSAPKTGADSPPGTGIREDGTTGPADTGTGVRADNDHLVAVPVVRGTETKRSFLVSANVFVPAHPGAKYSLRAQPYVDRGGLGLTSPGGLGSRTVDLAAVTNQFAILQVRADVVTNGGALADTSDDTGKVTYRYFVNNAEVGQADAIDFAPTAMRTGQGDVRFGPAFGLARGWQGDAPEAFVDNVAVYDIQNIPYRTSWIGETISPEDAAKYAKDNLPVQGRHVGQNVHAIWVDPVPVDGRTLVYTNTQWDEAARAMGVYSADSTTIRPYSSLGSTHGRNLGGFAITGDAESIYASYPRMIDVVGPTGKTTKVVDASCVTRIPKIAVKPDVGVPPTGTDLCLPDKPSASEPQPQSIRGLAASPDFLFVAHRQLGEIQVYRKNQLTTPVSKLAVPQPRGMAYAPDGTLWAIVDGAVQQYTVSPAGVLTPGRRLTGMIPSALTVDKDNRLYVADDARFEQLIRVFGSDLVEIQAKRLGDPGGVTNHGGEYAPNRFDGIAGVGVDGAGNYYVAGNGIGVSAARSPNFFDLRRFNGTTKALEAQALSYPSTTIVSPDPTAPNMLYSPTRQYTVNLDAAVPGTEWSPRNSTLMTDRYRCPEDARVGGIQGQQASIAVRRMGPDKYMFVTGQGDLSRLGVYRLTDDGKRSQPTVVFTENADNAVWPANEPHDYNVPGRDDDWMWSWRDKNGNCQFDTGEYDAPMYISNSSNWSVTEKDDLPDHRAGDLWLSGYANNRWNLKRVRFTGTFESGSPVYDTKNVELMPIPGQFGFVEGIVYQSTTDTLYLMGRPQQQVDQWKLARYDTFYAKHKAGTTQAPAWLKDLPDDISFCPYDEHKSCRIYSMTVAGDRVHVGNLAPATSMIAGRIRMYDTATGTFKGSLSAGPEVAHRSGWQDMRHAVTAMQLPDGRRYAFAEENFTGRILMYKDF
ncbi:hypothetical protein ALI144C_38200 [Actinosynnema sp. ALI-1.44]|nr:hypothetical protein ALI144C_38200 [Actinosynnema sp. ALI-1.44]